MRYLILLLIVGCASQLTEDEILEREYNQAINKENWYMCQKVYADNGSPTYSRHAHSKHRKHTDWDVKDDLTWNNCKFVLGSTSAEKM